MVEKEFLSKWTKTSGKTLKELTKIWEDIVTEVDKSYADKSDLERERIAKVLFRKAIGRELYSKRKPELFFGFIMGTSRLMDVNEALRRKALAAYRADPVQAQLEGLVDESGVPIDPREKLGARDNPHFHKPLTESLWTRKVYGVAMKEGTKVPMLFCMPLWRASAKNFRYKPFIPVEFLAIVKDYSKGYYLLSPSVKTKFQATKKGIDIEQWIRDASKIVPLGDLKEVASKNDKPDFFCLTEGEVDTIRAEINPETNSRSIILSDPDSGMLETVRVFVPGDFPIGFSELSRVIVLGRPRIWKRTDEDEERVSMEAYSVYAIPGKTISGVELPADTEGEPEADDGPIIEFVEEPVD